MFVVLQIEERAAGILQRLKEHMAPYEPELTKIAVKNGAPFFILKIKKRKQGVPWEEVAYAAGRCASRIVTAETNTLPDYGTIKRFVPEHLPFLMMFSTALEVMNKIDVSPSDLSIGVVDRRGVLVGVIGEATSHAGVVKVVTDRTERYAQAAEELMDECGVSLVYGADTELLQGCNVVICYDKTETGNTNAAIFSVTDSSILHDGELSFVAGLSCLPKEYALQLPSKIDSLIFASALYELCGVRILAKTTYTTLICGKEEISLYKAAQRLDRLFNG